MSSNTLCWQHDREAYVREIELEKLAAARAPVRKPSARKKLRGSTLDEAQFWKLMASVEGDDLEPLIVGLRRLKKADLCEFEEILAEKLYALDGKKYADHAAGAGGSDDAFLYARCAVVARGKTFYESVIADPSKFPPDVDCEPLLSAAGTAWEREHGEDLDHSTHVSYETGSNADGWPKP